MSKRTSARAFAPVSHAATNPYSIGVARGLLATVMSLALLVVSTSWFVYKDLATQVSVSAIHISGLGSQVPTAQSGGVTEQAPSDSFAGRALNILIVGIDSREDQGDDSFGSAEDVDSLRGDTTMLAHISADRSRVQVISIPRDLVTDIPNCTRSDGSVSGWTEGQFNSAISIGANWGYDVASGIACTKSTTELLTGLTVGAFVVVDFKGFESMVDALGGVWFSFDEELYDEDAGLHVVAGCHQLNGQQALAYARARYSLGDGSDLSRIGRQHKLVAAMLRDALSKNFVTDLPALISFIKQSLAAVMPSPNLADFNADVGLLLSLASIDKSGIQFLTMPVQAAPWDNNRVIALDYESEELWDSLAADLPLPGGMTYTDGMGVEHTAPNEWELQTNDDSSPDADSAGDPASTDASSSQADQSATPESAPSPDPILT